MDCGCPFAVACAGLVLVVYGYGGRQVQLTCAFYEKAFRIQLLQQQRSRMTFVLLIIYMFGDVPTGV